MPSASFFLRSALGTGVTLLAVFSVAGIAAGFESAEELRTATRAWLDRQVAQSERIEALDLSDVIAVARAGEGWHIGLPHARMRLAEKGGSLRIAGTGLRMAPRDDGLVALSWELPETIAHQPPEAAGEPGTGSLLRIAGREGGGIYDPRYGTFLSFDTLLEGLALALEGGASMMVARLGMRGESHPAGEGGFESRGSGRLSGLEFEAGPTTLRLANLRLDAALEGLQLERRDGASAGSADGDARPPAIFSFRTPVSDATAVRLELDDLAFTSGPRRLTLGSGGATAALDGLRGTHSALVLQLVLDGLQASPVSPLAQGLLPREMDIDLEMRGLPNAALADLIAQFSTLSAAVDTRYALGLTLTDFWTLMQRGGVEMRLDLRRWGADMLRTSGSIRVTPRVRAALGFEGELKLEIDRLPMLIEHLRADPQAQRLVQLLTLVQGLGIPADPAQPAGLRRYTVLVTADGRLDVNGTDVMPLVAGRRP